MVGAGKVVLLTAQRMPGLCCTLLSAKANAERRLGVSGFAGVRVNRLLPSQRVAGRLKFHRWGVRRFEREKRRPAGDCQWLSLSAGQNCRRRTL